MVGLNYRTSLAWKEGWPQSFILRRQSAASDLAPRGRIIEDDRASSLLRWWNITEAQK
jgi:hypothetical protein